MDADENERPESDEEEEEEEDDEEEEEARGASRLMAGIGLGGPWMALEEVVEGLRLSMWMRMVRVTLMRRRQSGRRVEANGLGRGSYHHLSNGFRVAPVGAASTDMEDEEEEEEKDVENDNEEEEDLVEEIYEEEGENNDVVEVHDVGDSDDDVDGLRRLGSLR